MTTLARLNFEDDLAEAQAQQESDWKIEDRGDLTAWVTVAPISAADEKFTAQMVWKDYPGSEPASVVFVDPETGATGVQSAWPTALGFRPPTDICSNWTAEGFALHPEWRSDATLRWDPRGNPLLASIRHLQHVLDLSFQGRAQ